MSKDSKIMIPDPKVFDQYIELELKDFLSFFVGTDTLEESNFYLNSLWRNMYWTAGTCYQVSFLWQLLLLT